MTSEPKPGEGVGHGGTNGEGSGPGGREGGSGGGGGGGGGGGKSRIKLLMAYCVGKPTVKKFSVHGKPAVTLTLVSTMSAATRPQVP